MFAIKLCLRMICSSLFKSFGCPIFLLVKYSYLFLLRLTSTPVEHKKTFQKSVMVLYIKETIEDPLFNKFQGLHWIIDSIKGNHLLFLMQNYSDPCGF